MECKRRGLFTRSKLVKALYDRGAKPSGLALHAQNGKWNKRVTVEHTADTQRTINKPKETSFSTSDFVLMNQDQVYPQQKPPKLTFVVPERAGRLENFQGSGTEDDTVDSRATRYISNVQERFRLECVKLEEMQLI